MFSDQLQELGGLPDNVRIVGLSYGSTMSKELQEGENPLEACFHKELTAWFISESLQFVPCKK